MAAKLAVIHRLEVIIAVKDVSLNTESLWNIDNSLSASSQSLDFNVHFNAENEPLIITSSEAVDLTDELLKELQGQ